MPGGRAESDETHEASTGLERLTPQDMHGLRAFIPGDKEAIIEQPVKFVDIRRVDGPLNHGAGRAVFVQLQLLIHLVLLLKQFRKRSIGIDPIIPPNGHPRKGRKGISVKSLAIRMDGVLHTPMEESRAVRRRVGGTKHDHQRGQFQVQGSGHTPNDVFDDVGIDARRAGLVSALLDQEHCDEEFDGFITADWEGGVHHWRTTGVDQVDFCP